MYSPRDFPTSEPRSATPISAASGALRGALLPAPRVGGVRALATALILLVLPVLQAAPAASPPPIARPAIPAAAQDDPRLDAPTTIATAYRPVPEVLAAMQRQCRVNLTASPAVADDRVTLFLDAKSAREAMALIA